MIEKLPYSAWAPDRPMQPQRIRDIKKSVNEMDIDELQTMSDDLSNLISVLITRQVAIEDEILDRLDATFAV